MPEVTLADIMVETKKTHTELQTAVSDLVAANEKIAVLEAKKGYTPADAQELQSKIDTAVEAHDTKHASLIEQFEAVEAKLNDMEEAESKGINAEQKLDTEHTMEFKQFMRYGKKQSANSTKGADAARLEELQMKSLYAGSDPDGGFAIPRPMSNMIQTAKRDATPFRQEAASTTVSGDMFRYLIDIGEASAGWVTERAARGVTNTTQMQEAQINVHEMYAGPALTQTILDDAAFPIEQWLGEKTAESFADLEANAFLLGNGVGKPRGALTYSAGTSWGQIAQINSGSATAITPDQLMAQQDDLKELYSNNAKWYMNRRTLTNIRQLKSDLGTGFQQYLWQPGLTAGAPSTILGDPIVKMNYMPVIGANNLAVMFGDLKRAYLIVDRAATRVLRDPYTNTPYVIFKTNARVGGDVVNFEAINLMKCATV